MPYTLDDMAAAQAELDDAQRRFDDYEGNNPNKHRAALRPARLRLDLIVSDLRQRGIIPTPEPTAGSCAHSTPRQWRVRTCQRARRARAAAARRDRALRPAS